MKVARLSAPRTGRLYLLGHKLFLLEKVNDHIGNRTRDIPAYSAVPQPNAPLGTPRKTHSKRKRRPFAHLCAQSRAPWPSRCRSWRQWQWLPSRPALPCCYTVRLEATFAFCQNKEHKYSAFCIQLTLCIVNTPITKGQYLLLQKTNKPPNDNIHRPNVTLLRENKNLCIKEESTNAVK
jgi:hypothetical protein